MNRAAALLLLAATAVCACTINPVPMGYTGKVAHLTDSMTPRSDDSADYFYVSKTGDWALDNSLSVANGNNRALGVPTLPSVIGRDIPTDEASFTINGRTHYTTPLTALAHTVFGVTGVTTFTPVADHNYVVKGVLGPDYSAVWIEDSTTGQVAGQKVEVKGSAALGVLGKTDLN